MNLFHKFFFKLQRATSKSLRKEMYSIEFFQLLTVLNNSNDELCLLACDDQTLIKSCSFITTISWTYLSNDKCDECNTKKEGFFKKYFNFLF